MLGSDLECWDLSKELPFTDVFVPMQRTENAEDHTNVKVIS